MSTNDRIRTNRDAPGVRGGSNSSEEDPTTGFKSGVNPLYGSDIMGGDSTSSQDVVYTPSTSSKNANKDGTGTVVATPTESTVATGAGSTEASVTRRSSLTHAKRPSARGTSPQSTLTASTSQSSTSSRMTQTSKNVSNGSSKKSAVRVREAKTRSSRQENSAKEAGPTPLVPAHLAPVPPPPPKRKRARKPSGDVETGDAASEPTVLEEAPDKTAMEMLQSYLKKQDIYTRIVFVVLLLVLAGGALGAYVIMLVYAIQEQDVKYIVLSVVLSIVLFWVIYKVRSGHCCPKLIKVDVAYQTQPSPSHPTSNILIPSMEHVWNRFAWAIGVSFLTCFSVINRQLALASPPSKLNVKFRKHKSPYLVLYSLSSAENLRLLRYSIPCVPILSVAPVFPHYTYYTCRMYTYHPCKYIMIL